MKTQIIIREGWAVIAEFDYLLPLSKGDVVATRNGIDYRVDYLFLDLNDNMMKVMLR